MSEVLFHSISLVLLLIGPAVAFAVAAHFIELNIQQRLVRLFGWKSVMWTGWLGTPIHELSHVVLCWVFRHRVDEVRLFDPDIRTGRLGFVRHSFRRGNWFEEFGNVFIGTAPLFGGSLAMFLLLLTFYPEFARELMAPHSSGDTATWAELGQSIARSMSHFLQSLFQWANLTKLRFWIFLYLNLCIASHMAPSRSDYDGAARGAWLVIGFVWLVSLLLVAFSKNALDMAFDVFRLVTPVITLAGLALVLCAVAWTGVVALETAVSRR